MDHRGGEVVRPIHQHHEDPYSACEACDASAAADRLTEHIRRSSEPFAASLV